MKTLLSIIESAKNNEKVDYEDLLYAMLALNALHNFNARALMKIGVAERDGKKPFLTSSGWWQYNEDFNRTKAALNKSPKEYVGWTNDPKNPEYQKFRKVAERVFEKATGE